jgi:hypothetical protein
VHHAVSVRVVEGVRHFAAERERLVQVEVVLAPEAVPERLPFDVGHDIVQETSSLARVMEREDVRMSQAGGQLDFTEKALRPDRRGELGPENLHGHRPSVLRVVGEKYARHPAPAELPLDQVSTAERGGDAVDEGGHAVSARRGRLPAA